MSYQNFRQDRMNLGKTKTGNQLLDETQISSEMKAREKIRKYIVQNLRLNVNRSLHIVFSAI